MGKVLFFLFTIFMLLQSCKEEDLVYPNVEILSPSENSRYSYGDTITLVFRASPVTSVNYSILVGDILVNVKDFLLYQRGNEYTVEFYLNNRYLENGKHTIRVRAENGKAAKSEFLEIFIDELELEVRGYVSVGSSSLMKVDSLGQSSTIGLVNSYSWVEANAFEGAIMVGDNSNLPLEVYNFNNLNLQYNVPSSADPGFRYYQILSNGQYFFALDNRGYVRSYGNNGTIGPSALMPNNIYPQQATFLGDRLAVIGNALGQSGVSELNILNSNFNGIYKSATIAVSAYQVCNFENDKLAIFKWPNQTELEIYNATNGTLTSMFDLGDEIVNDCEQLNNGQLVFTTDKGVYTFQIGVTITPNKVLNFGVPDIEVSQLDGSVLILNSGAIQELDQNGGLSFRAPAAIGATDFEILYNK